MGEVAGEVGGGGSGDDSGDHDPGDGRSQEVERYLHEHIPLTRSMGVGVAAADDARVVLEAPLSPNINHRDTAFGGSVSALAILAGWTLIHLRLRGTELESRRIVIQRNEMEYLHPIDGDFEAVCTEPNPKAWGRFLGLLRKRGMGRISVEAEVVHEGRVAGRFRGDYVALPQDA